MGRLSGSTSIKGITRSRTAAWAALALCCALYACTALPPSGEGVKSTTASSTAPRSNSEPAHSQSNEGGLQVLDGSLPALPAAYQAPPLPAMAGSQWQLAAWADLPSFAQDGTLHAAWSAWLRSCMQWAALAAARAGGSAAALPAASVRAAFEPHCPALQALLPQSDAAKRAWLQARFAPYAVLPNAGATAAAQQGLLTGYYEPEFKASRTPTQSASGAYRYPLYAEPEAAQRGYTRREFDTLPSARAALAGKALVYLNDPIDVLLLQIQGSGRVTLIEPNPLGQPATTVRMAYASTNGRPYESVGRYLLSRGEIREGSWEAIRAWARANPSRVNELLWANPRVVFFREEAIQDTLDGQAAGVLPAGPKGAQGVPLTAGGSIAVDRTSIPYGTPVWLASSGIGPGGVPGSLQHLVVAQDTGSAIVGAVRADYYAGTGDAAYALAGKLKQPLKLWAIWPR